jgi:regulatory protein
LPESAYIAALTMLARRELSTTQVRQRLARRKYSSEDIDAAVERLTADRSLDDARVAGAIARSQLSLKKRGRLRVRREIEAAGISRTLADRAIAEAFDGVDAEALLESALDRRLGAKAIDDDRAAARLYRYLIGQGFDAERVGAAIRKRRRRG